MVPTLHILVGAAIGARIRKPGLIVILGLLLHFIMDKIIHWEYSLSGIENFPKTGDYKELLLTILKILIDLLIGLLIVFLIARKKNFLNKNYLPYIILGIFFSLLPDILLAIAFLLDLNVFTEAHIAFYHKYLHFKKEGNIALPGLITQISAGLLAIAVLLFNHIPQKFGKNSSQGNGQNHSENSAQFTTNK